MRRPIDDRDTSALRRHRRQLRTTARLTAFIGGPVFWLGTLLHPARDGWSIAAVGERYGLTHDIQAAGLLLQVVCLASVIALGNQITRRRDLSPGTAPWSARCCGSR